MWARLSPTWVLALIWLCAAARRCRQTRRRAPSWCAHATTICKRWWTLRRPSAGKVRLKVASGLPILLEVLRGPCPTCCNLVCRTWLQACHALAFRGLPPHAAGGPPHVPARRFTSPLCRDMQTWCSFRTACCSRGWRSAGWARSHRCAVHSCLSSCCGSSLHLARRPGCLQLPLFVRRAGRGYAAAHRQLFSRLFGQLFSRLAVGLRLLVPMHLARALGEARSCAVERRFGSLLRQLLCLAEDA